MINKDELGELLDWALDLGIDVGVGDLIEGQALEMLEERINELELDGAFEGTEE